MQSCHFVDVSNFVDDDLLVITVATDETDGFRRFMRSARKYNLNVTVGYMSICIPCELVVIILSPIICAYNFAYDDSSSYKMLDACIQFFTHLPFPRAAVYWIMGCSILALMNQFLPIFEHSGGN